MRFDSFLTPREIVTSGQADGQPAVSIVMPTYRRNHEGLLTRAIDSILGQTFRDFEFIIIDDGSTDGTEGVCRACAARDPRIVYVRHNENCGLPAVRTNEGILLARAPYVAFMFDDNVWASDALEVFMREMQAQPVDILHGNTELIFDAGKKQVLGNWPLTLELLTHMNTIPNGAVLCRREFFEQHGMYDPHLIVRRVCDWDLWLRGLRLGATFRHCDRTMGVEYGPSSPASIGRSVQWDYKTTYAYMACEKGSAARSEALRPGTIAGYDVFDPERVLPHLRDFQEWETVEQVVYEPFFQAHPSYTWEPPLGHNRRYDAGLAGYSLNAPRRVFDDRLRVLLISNRFHRIIEDWKKALAANMNAVVISCNEWELAAFEPSEVDLLVLFDSTAPYLAAVVRQFAGAGVPIAYCIVHGLDAPAANGPDPLGYLDFARLSPITGILGDSVYYSLPGRPWRADQRAGAEELMTLANQVFHLGGDGKALGARSVTGIDFVPTGGWDRSRPASGPVRPALFLGDPGGLARETIEAAGRLLEQTPEGTVWTILAARSASLPSAWEKHRGRWQRESTNDPLPVLAARLRDTCLLVPDEVLARYDDFHRDLIEEDLARNGSALAGIGEVLRDLSGALSSAWLRERTEASRARYAERGFAAHREARALHWTNLAMATRFLGLRARADGENRYDPRKIYTFLNSSLVTGAEVVGLLLSQVLRRLGFDAHTCVPTRTVFTDKDDCDLVQWLDSRGMPLPIKVDYNLGVDCLAIPEAEALREGRRLTEWLDAQRVGVVLTSGFISEPLLTPQAGRLVYLGLMQPWVYPLEEMTFLRDRVQGLFSDSRWSTSQWARWMPPPVEWIPSIVEARHFQRREGRPSDTVRIAVGGTLQPRKRQREALQAVRALLQEGYDLEVNIYGYELAMLRDYVQEVKKLAEEPLLRGRVKFHGVVDMASIVRDNDVLLTVSSDESMPQTMLFAMAGGLVPVACPAGGIAEVVRNEETGFLAEDFSVEAIRKALTQCLQQRERWPELTARGQALLVEEYSEPVVANRFMHFLLLGSAIASSPGAGRFQVSRGGRAQNGGGTAANGSVQVTRVRAPAEAGNHQMWNGPDVGQRGVLYRLHSEHDRLSGLRWCVGTYATLPRGKLKLTLIAETSGEVVREVEADLKGVADHKWLQAHFPPIVNSRGQNFLVLARAEISEGRYVFFERWPYGISRPRALASRVHKRLGQWLGIRLSRRYSPFYPLYGSVR